MRKVTVAESLSDRLVRRLTAAGLQVVALCDDAIEVAVIGGEKTATLSLLNLRRTLSLLPEAHHEAAIGRFARLAVVGLTGAGEGELLPRLTAPGDPRSLSAPWFTPIADGLLWLTLVEDRGEVLRYVRTMDIVRWRRSVADVRQAAMDNLTAWSAGVVPESMGEGVYRFATGDGLDAARLLILSRWFTGPQFALPVSRDQLWVTADPQRAGVLRQAIGPAAHRLPHAITDRLIRHEAGVLTAWVAQT
jgi:hypothetical protein